MEVELPIKEMILRKAKWILLIPSGGVLGDTCCVDSENPVHLPLRWSCYKPDLLKDWILRILWLGIRRGVPRLIR